MPQTQPRAFLASLLLALASTAGALLVAEWLTRLLYPQDVGSIVNIYVQDEALQYKYQPDARARQKSPEFDVAIATNSMGFRNREVAAAKPPGTCRIMVVGDSFSVGHGVAVEDGYASRLEDRLNARPDTAARARWEVVNASVSGYHLYHYMRSVELYAGRLDADLVVVGFFIGNDFGAHDPAARRIVRNGYLGRYESGPRDEGDLATGERVRRWLTPLREWLGTRSHLYTLFVRSASPALARAGLASGDTAVDFRVYERTPGPAVEGRFAATAALLDATARAAATAGAALLVAVIPERFQVDDALWAGALTAAGLPPAAAVPDAPNEKLDAMLDTAGIARLDLLPALRAGGGGLYFPRDGHWNEAGHALAADALATRIAAMIAPGEAAVALRCLAQPAEGSA
jgi:hypothetical protein